MEAWHIIVIILVVLFLLKRRPPTDFRWRDGHPHRSGAAVFSFGKREDFSQMDRARLRICKA